MDFLILSAGFDYYIQHALERAQLGQVKVITNKGEFVDNGFALKPDKGMKYYSKIYGIDKGQVVIDCKKKYEKVYFAGDSEPDLRAAIQADVIFAKGELVELLKKEQKEFYEFKQFSEVLKLMKEGV
jgi:2-hydroxy-3-keto-5-methylthiopentenyl-1-phosphate phosphatase